jgi:hypothetical protein
MLTSDLASLRAALEDDPLDWECRLVLADALQEMGRDQEAAGQRWQAQHQKRPMPIESLPACVWYSPPPPDLINPRDPESDLPLAIFQSLDGFQKADSHPAWPSWLWKFYETAESAEQALARALSGREEQA